MKRRHLERRGCRGRAIAWARVPVQDAGHLVGIDYRLFVRVSATGASLMEARTFSMCELASAVNPRTHIARHLRGMRTQLRWRRDQLDFQLLGMVDDTPAPARVGMMRRALAWLATLLLAFLRAQDEGARAWDGITLRRRGRR